MRTSNASPLARLWTVVSLAVLFLIQVVLAGVTTAWIIVRPGERPHPGLIRMGFENLNETGAAILGCLLTLTPGSTVLDVDMEKQELLLHLLDASDPASTVREIRTKFERRLQRVFPAREAA